MTGSLAGKRAVVTGAASGIGRAIAVAFAALARWMDLEEVKAAAA